TYTGVIYADAETFKLMATGKEVSPSKYYIRNTPVFETKSPKYDWLNHIVTVSVGTLTPTGVVYKVYAIK
ncbi:MAG: hypothetical protein JWP81_448, partial [Ferruginibacter sp.]|nr:hypothetical protein [Ferruginibacter sp.]